MGLSAYRLASMRRAARCGFWLVLLNDGISWCFFTLPPTMGAVFTFYLGKTTPAQGIALVISSTMHAIMACRAYRNLSDFADTLPLSFRARDKVRDGTMLDQETLARLAWFTGAAGAEEEGSSRKETSIVDSGTEDRLYRASRPSDFSFSSFASVQGAEKISHGTRHSRQSSQPLRVETDRPPVYRSRTISTCTDRHHLSSSSSGSLEKNGPAHRRALGSLDMLSAQVESVGAQSLSPGGREPLSVHITTQMQSMGDDFDTNSCRGYQNTNSASSTPHLGSPPARPARCEGADAGRRRTQYVLRRPSHVWAPAPPQTESVAQDEAVVQAFPPSFVYGRQVIGQGSFLRSATMPSTTTTPTSADASPLDTEAN